MLTPIRTNQFKRDYKKIISRGKKKTKLHDLIEILLNEKLLPPKYQDHKLTGNYVGRRECHIEPDWLLVYKVENPSLILERTGSHADLFK